MTSYSDHADMLCGGCGAGCPHCDEERARYIKSRTPANSALPSSEVPAPVTGKSTGEGVTSPGGERFDDSAVRAGASPSTIPMRTPAGASARGVGGNEAHATIAEPSMSRRGGDEGGRTKASKDSDAAAPSASPDTLAATTAAVTTPAGQTE